MTEYIDKAIRAEWQVVLYREVLRDPLVEKFLILLKMLQKTIPVQSQVLHSYYDFATAFIPKAAAIAAKGRSAWEDYILELVIRDENVFSIQAEKQKFDEIPEPLKTIAVRDLNHLQRIAQVSCGSVRRILAERVGLDAEANTLPDWEGIVLTGKRPEPPGSGNEELKNKFGALEEWGTGIGFLADYYRRNGVGLFGWHHAFRWVKNGGAEGKLVGVKNPDPIKMSQLYEYEAEQAKVIQNTEQFLRGYPANNVLLYGDRGTGKSSTVKALVNMYGEKGLRLVEIQKQDLHDFPEVIAQLAERPQRFILYIDDLSFGEHEGQYRELKALLEGGLEARPHNVVVYATSNRRHLVLEKFSDRTITGSNPDNEEIRHMDTLEEKLSLADRFGITVTFASPDKKRYLAIVEKLARERGLSIPKEELFSRALKWEMSFNSRSARTARQFVDFLEGQLALEQGSVQE